MAKNSKADRRRAKRRKKTAKRKTSKALASPSCPSPKTPHDPIFTCDDGERVFKVRASQLGEYLKNYDVVIFGP